MELCPEGVLGVYFLKAVTGIKPSKPMKDIIQFIPE